MRTSANDDSESEASETTTVAELLARHAMALPDGLGAAHVTRPGRLAPAALPLDHPDADLIAFIPAYSRQLSDDGTHLGTLPLLVRDLARSAEREHKQISVLLSDDSSPEDAALNEQALSLALDRIEHPPPVWIVGRQDRTRTFQQPDNQRLLRRMLASELATQGSAVDLGNVDRHMKTLEFLVTRGGYGPQRVRGHGMTFGVPQPVMSRDSDLALVHAEATDELRAQVAEAFDAGFGFVFADAGLEPSLCVRHCPDAPFLGQVARAGLGLTLGELRARHPALPVYGRVKITKDRGLEHILARPDVPSEMHVAAEAPVEGAPLDAIVVSVTAHKWGAADINGHAALLNAVTRPGPGLAALAVSASARGIRHGEIEGLFVRQTPNPDCAVETALACDPRRMIPWLVTNPDISGLGGELLHLGARAEDQLRTNCSDPRLMFAYSPEALYHVRAQSGRKENAVQTFVSEDVGDVLAGVVRARLRFDEAADYWAFDAPTIRIDSSLPFERRMVDEELRPEMERVWARAQIIRDAIAHELGGAPPHRPQLEAIAAELDQRFTTSYRQFEARLLDYLAQQVHFVRSVLLCYPVVLRGLREIRRADRFYAQRWSRE